MYCPFLNYRTLCPIKFHRLDPMYKANNSFRKLDPPLSVTTTNVQNSTSEIIENLLIPVFHGSANPQILSHINNNVKNDILEFKNQMEAAAKEHARFLKLQGKQPDPFQIATTYSITYDKNNILSFSIFFQEYFSGKHNDIRTSYNYDLSTGNSISLGDLFRQGVDYSATLNKIAKQQLQTNYPSIAANYKGIAKDQPFYLDNNALVIYPRFNEIAPVVSAIPLIRIPFTNINNILKPHFV